MATSSSASPRSPEGDLGGRLLAGRYRINRAIASGGMAEVWEATDQVLTRRVAVKLLHRHLANDASFVRRFRAEAIAAARLAHPSIVSVYDTFSEDGLEAIVMELVVGTTLRADLDEHGPLRLDALLAIGTQVADALGAAHASGLVHRDVKPANILLSADGRVLVADFGIAKAAEGADLTSDGSMVGTAKYLAPEQVEGTPLDGRADLYALGVVLYEAATGTAPFVAETDAGTALARLHRDPTPPRQLRQEIPSSVEAVVLQAMARNRDLRFSDAAAMRAALVRAGADPAHAPAVAQAAVAAASGEHRIPTTKPPPPPRPATDGARVDPSRPPAADLGTDPTEGSRRRRWPWAVVAVLVLGAAVAVIALNAGSHSTTAIIPLASASSFDPFGDNKTEHQELVGLAIDRDPASAWRTEDYHQERILGKGGVGLVVALKRTSAVREVRVRSTDPGWTASIYATTQALPPDLNGWGKAIGEVRSARPGDTTISVTSTRAKAVLVWFTRVGDKGIVHVGDVTVRGGR